MATATAITTGTVRLSFVNVFTPRAAYEGQAEKYSACILIPKSDTKTVAAIKAACEAARLGSANIFNGKVPASLKTPLHDGDGEMPNGGEYGPECKGMWVLNASSKIKPVVVDRQCVEIMDSTEIYSGCWAKVNLNFFAYSAQGNKGIAAGLNGVQKIRDDEPLGGGRPSAKSMFSVEDDDDLGL